MVWSPAGRKAWGAQEKTKGRNRLSRITGSKEAGWGFNEHYKSLSHSQAILLSSDDLKTQPFFRKSPGQLFKGGQIARDYAKNHRFEILAKGIPARTFGIGANATGTCKPVSL